MTEANTTIIATDAFWALIALVIFIVILFIFKIPSMLGRILDKRAQDIANELDESRRLKEEAQQLLAEYQHKRQEAEAQAKDIVAAAKREAKQLCNDMRQASQNYILQRNKQAEDKIKLAEEEAVKYVRQHAIDISVNLAKEFLSSDIYDNKKSLWFDASLQELKDSSKQL